MGKSAFCAFTSGDNDIGIQGIGYLWSYTRDDILGNQTTVIYMEQARMEEDPKRNFFSWDACGIEGMVWKVVLAFQSWSQVSQVSV